LIVPLEFKDFDERISLQENATNEELKRKAGVESIIDLDICHMIRKDAGKLAKRHERNL
jgi:hypothetical protein